MSCSDYNCGTVLHGIFRIQADDDALRGQVRSPPSAQNGLLRRSATEQIWDSGRMTGKWEFIGSSIGLVPTNGLGVPEADFWPASSLGLTPRSSLIRREQIQGRDWRSFRLQLVPKASPCFPRQVMVEFDNHRERISG